MIARKRLVWNPSTDDYHCTTHSPQYGPRTNWSPYEQGLLLGAFSYAYPLSSLLCGLLLQRYSIGRELIAVGFLLTAALYAIAPLASRTQHSFAALFAIRFLMGAAQGGAFVNVHRVMTRWAPRSELGLFSFAISGSNVGVMLTLATSGPIIEAFGWRWSFYCTAVQVLVFVAAWWRLVYDAPDLHPRIAAEERRYIDANLPTSTGQSNVRMNRPNAKRMDSVMIEFDISRNGRQSVGCLPAYRSGRLSAVSLPVISGCISSSMVYRYF